MAAINNSINLTDRMSPVLKTVLKALDSTMKAMDQLDRATNKGMNSTAFKRARADIDAANAAISSLNGQLVKTGSLMDRVSQKAAKTSAAIYGAGVINREVSRQGGGKLLGIKGVAQIGAGKLLGGISQIPSVMKTFASSVSSGFDTISDRCKLAYTETLSFINLVEKGIGAINGLMSANDAVTSDIAKIGLFNFNPNMSNAQAYGMAYKAAENSRSDLSDTTNLINRIMMSGVYGQKAGSLSSATRMAETLNKAMVIGGGTSEENKRALVQLSQGLSSGVLQGDELRSIREQSPYLAQVLAQGLAQVDDKFIGTTVGDLKELGSQGELTSDVVIKAFEAMQDQVDSTFSDKAPRTWAQGIQSISNTIKAMTGYLQYMEGGPLEKISELVWIIADYLKSEDGIKLLSGIATALSVVGTVLTWVVQAALTGISWLMNNSTVLLSILLAVAGVLVVLGTQAFIAFMKPLIPILLIAAAIYLVINILQGLGLTFDQIVGGVCGGIMVMIAFFKNLGLSVWGVLMGIGALMSALATNVELTFKNIGLNIRAFFAGILSDILGLIESIAAALNKLPFVSFNYSGISGAAKKWANIQSKSKGDIAKNKAAMKNLGDAFTKAYDSAGAFKKGWASDAYNKGYEWGAGGVNRITSSIGNFTDGITGGLKNFMEGSTALYDSATGAGAGGGGRGVNVKGGNLDSVGAIKNDVNINDEDIQLLRDMAARDYLLNLQQITPVAHISFGDVRETADVNKIMDVIEDMVEEQMATALVAN